MKIKNAGFLLSDAMFSPEEIVGELIRHCKKIEIETDGTPDKICSLQIITDGEVVRCKDCKYWETKEGLHDWCKNKMLYMNADDFCSKGEKKDE